MIKQRFLFFLMIPTLIMASCKTNKDQQTETKSSTSITRTIWGQADGQEVHLFTLTNSNDVTVKITNYGGIVTSWMAPDRNGTTSDIVLGYNTLEEYLAGHPAFGALIGRYANRIGKASFSLEGTTYTLVANNGENHLHGGTKGFDKVVWNATIDETSSPAALVLQYQSKDGEEGYPGNLHVTATYRLTDDNELVITYDATTDKATHINLTNHSYFTLTGDYSKNILDHYLTIYADHYLPVDKGMIPTGEIKALTGTAFDFTKPEKIGNRINDIPGGYDHTYVLNHAGDDPVLSAVLYDSLSGRKIETYTSEPGIQIYTGNFLNGRYKSSDGIPFEKHGGVCLETQHFPDSPNKPDFPSTILRPGERYSSVTKYKFSIEQE